MNLSDATIRFEKSNVLYTAEILDVDSMKGPYSELTIRILKEEPVMVNGEWVCNQCNNGTLPSWIPEIEIDAEVHSCSCCGGFEFHKD